jgi:peptidoglycan-associated lipoprotein
MHPFRFLVLIMVSFLCLPHVQAQDANPKNQKKVAKLIDEADKLFSNREQVLAEAKYQEALKLDPTNFHAVYRIGRCYWYMMEPETAVQWYRSALDIDANANDTLFLDLAVALRKLDRCYEAKDFLNQFLKRHPDKNDYYAKAAQLELAGCEFTGNYKASVAGKNPPYKVEPININDDAGDFGPVIYNIEADTFMVFTSHRAQSRGKRQFMENGEPKYSDLYVARRTSDSTFDAVENLGKKINTKANDGAAAIDPSGLLMYYTICGGGKYQKFYGCSVYQSEFNTDAKQWGKYKKVEGINGETEAVVNSKGKTKTVPTYDAQPSLSADGTTMFFISDRDGGFGGMDIWYSQKLGNAWSTPVNAGPQVNSEFDEIWPHLGADGKTLYFSSNGRPENFGGFDVYSAKGNGTNKWSKAEPLPQPINSSYDDFSIHWSIQDSIGYFASDRPGMNTGSDNILWIKKLYYPPIVITVHGTVRDSNTKQVVPFAIVTLYEKNKNGSLTPVDTFRTDQTGRYNFVLERDKDYKMVGTAPDYLANEVSVSTLNIEESTDFERDIDIYLDRIDIGKPIVLENIYFDFDSATLRPESFVVLDRLVKLLMDNPQISIQIGGHTDTNGTEKYNQRLSDRRAKVVVNYLVEQAIDADRLTWFGYGESQPMIYPELSDSDEQANRRTEFRINSVNWKPKAKK